MGSAKSNIPNVILLCLFLSISLIFSNNTYADTPQGIDYQALSLEDCLALAHKYNPLLGASREKIRELVADYDAARSKFFPLLALGSYYQRLAPDRLPPGGSLPAGQQLFSLETLNSVTGKQIIFDGLKTYYNSRAAKIGIRAQELEVQRTRDEVAFAVTEAFYRLIEAKENLKVAEETLQQRQDFAALTEAFFKAGKVTRLDSFRAQSQVSEAEQAKVEAENAARLAREILSRTLGLREEVEVGIRGQLPQQFAAAGNVKSLWQEALKNNPEIKSLDLGIEQSQASIKAARGGYFPEISLQGNAGVRHRNVGGTEPEWLFGVFMEYPFFEGGLTKAQVAKACSQKLQLLEKKRDFLNTLKVDLRTAWTDQENSRQGVVTSRQTITTNEEAYASAQTLYRYGKAIGLDVLLAQVELTSSRFTFIKYAVAYEIARARIRQLVGSGLPKPDQQTDIGEQEK
jgi:outer membrane protein